MQPSWTPLDTRTPDGSHDHAPGSMERLPPQKKKPFHGNFVRFFTGLAVLFTRVTKKNKFRNVRRTPGRPRPEPMTFDLEELLPLPDFISAVRGRHNDRVFYMRNGNICARKYLVPPNPRTAEQQKGRKYFARAVKDWKDLDTEAKARWNTDAKAMKKRGYSLFLSVRLQELRAEQPNDAGTTAPVQKPPRRRVLSVSRKRRPVPAALPGARVAPLSPEHTIPSTRRAPP